MTRGGGVAVAGGGVGVAGTGVAGRGVAGFGVGSGKKCAMPDGEFSTRSAESRAPRSRMSSRGRPSIFSGMPGSGPLKVISLPSNIFIGSNSPIVIVPSGLRRANCPAFTCSPDGFSTTSPSRIAMMLSETFPTVPVIAAVRLGVLIVPPPCPFGMKKTNVPFFRFSVRLFASKVKIVFCPMRTIVPSSYFSSARESLSLRRKFIAFTTSCDSAGRVSLRSPLTVP